MIQFVCALSRRKRGFKSRRGRQINNLLEECLLSVYKEDRESRVSHLMIDDRLRRMLFSAGFDSHSGELSPKLGAEDSVGESLLATYRTALEGQNAARSRRNTRSSQHPYVRFVRAPPSNGIGLIRSFCARWIAAFTTIFALFKNLGWEEKYCLSWQSSSSGSAHAPAYQ